MFFKGHRNIFQEQSKLKKKILLISNSKVLAVLKESSIKVNGVRKDGNKFKSLKPP